MAPVRGTSPRRAARRASLGAPSPPSHPMSGGVAPERRQPEAPRRCAASLRGGGCRLRVVRSRSPAPKVLPAAQQMLFAIDPLASAYQARSVNDMGRIPRAAHLRLDAGARVRGAGARGPRALRRPRLHRRAADARDRRAHGARREPCTSYSRARERGCGRHRPVHRNRRSSRDGADVREPSLRSRPWRSRGPHRGARRARHGCAHRDALPARRAARVDPVVALRAE